MQREFRRLVNTGAIERTSAEPGDTRVYFAANEGHDAWRAWTLLLRWLAAPADVLREALVDVAGIAGAFVFGSTVRDEARPDSGVDLFLIVEEGQPSKERRRPLSEAEFLIGKPIDVVEYNARVAHERAGAGNLFLQRVLSRIRIILDSREIQEPGGHSSLLPPSHVQPRQVDHLVRPTAEPAFPRSRLNPPASCRAMVGGTDSTYRFTTT